MIENKAIKMFDFEIFFFLLKYKIRETSKHGTHITMLKQPPCGGRLCTMHNT